MILRSRGACSGAPRQAASSGAFVGDGRGMVIALGAGDGLAHLRAFFRVTASFVARPVRDILRDRLTPQVLDSPERDALPVARRPTFRQADDGHPFCICSSGRSRSFSLAPTT